jgi:hypothetical protein
MFPALHTIWRSEEQNGIAANPSYDGSSTSGAYALRESTAGHDSATKLPNFNDDFQDDGPDLGAQERGRASMAFGAQ